jgi:HSP20 family molecular chaperone IbpA
MATWLKEHRFGSFRRSLQLPQEVNESEINAHFEDGEGTSG